MKQLTMTAIRAGVCVGLALVSMAAALHPAHAAEDCKDAFRRPPFVELKLVDYSDTSVLSNILKPLVGMTCTLGELQSFLVSKGASLDLETSEVIYLRVSSWNKLISKGRLALPVSIIARVQQGRINYIDAGVTFF